MTRKFYCRAKILLAALLLVALPGGARAEKSMSTVNHGWNIVWNDISARATHVETGREFVLFQDEKTKTGIEIIDSDYAMLSVVGPVVSWTVDRYGEGGANPSYAKMYRTVDLAKIDPKAPQEKYDTWVPPADLAALFGEKAVFRRLLRDPFVQAAINGEFAGKKEPQPETLDELLGFADGGCEINMGEALVTDFGFSYVLDGRIAVVRIGLTHACFGSRGHFTRLTPLYFPIPEALAEDFRRAVSSGALEDKPFQKASFDCNKASVAIEFAICTDPRLAELDVAMAKRYRALRRKRTDADRQALKQAQRDWIEKRGSDCAAVVPCLIESYEARLEELSKQ